MSPGHGGRSHGRHDGDDDAEWMQLLRPSEFREVLEIDRARQDVERQIIHSNQAKLAGRSEAERREWTTSGYGMAGVGASAARRRQDDVMSHLYSKASRGGQDDREAPPRSWRWRKAGPAPVAEDTGLGCGLPVGTSQGFGVVTMLVTVGSVGMYLYETTFDERDDGMGGGGWYKTGHGYPFWFLIVEVFLTAFFTVELGLRAVMADHDRSFWLSTARGETVVDILSVVPSVLFVAFDLRLWGFLRFLRLVRWADVVTIFNGRWRIRTNEMADKNTATSDETAEGVLARKRESLTSGLKLLAFVGRYVLVYAGCVLLLSRAEGDIEDISEADPEDAIDFTSALYMAATMLSTVGEGVYGPVPMSRGARLASVVAVLVFVPLAAIRVADVIKNSSTARTPARAVSLPSSVRERHVVMCGSVNATNLKARLQEMFHLDHGNHNIRWVRVVVMSPKPPGPRIDALLEHPRYRGRVTYLQGSPLHDDSLLKARVDDASAVMVLADKAPPSSHAEDMGLSLQAISVMTHVELDRRQGCGPRLLVELVDPNAALHLQAAGIKHVVSSAQVKLSVLAQSCLCPGWAAVVANLLESRAALPAEVLQQGSWLAEYYVGAKKTFYSVEFSPAFTGVLFGDAVVHIFEYFELILVAVETKRLGQAGLDGEYNVVVNPGGDYRIGKGDRGFLLAESQADARVIWDYMAEDGMGGAIDEGTGRLKERFSSPEEEEALAMETLGTAGVAGMGPETFVDSMVFSRTLLHCQKKLPDGRSPDIGLLLEWARQFQASNGMSDKKVVKKVLASAGLEPPVATVPESAGYDALAAAVPTSRTATSKIFASALAKKPSNHRWDKQEMLGRPGGSVTGDAASTLGPSGRRLRKAGARGGPGARERFLSDVIDEEDLSIVSPLLGRDEGGDEGGTGRAGRGEGGGADGDKGGVDGDESRAGGGDGGEEGARGGGGDGDEGQAGGVDGNEGGAGIADGSEVVVGGDEGTPGGGDAYNEGARGEGEAGGAEGKFRGDERGISGDEVLAGGTDGDEGTFSGEEGRAGGDEGRVRRDKRGIDGDESRPGGDEGGAARADEDIDGAGEASEDEGRARRDKLGIGGDEGEARGASKDADGAGAASEAKGGAGGDEGGTGGGSEGEAGGAGDEGSAFGGYAVGVDPAKPAELTDHAPVPLPLEFSVDCLSRASSAGCSSALSGPAVPGEEVGQEWGNGSDGTEVFGNNGNDVVGDSRAIDPTRDAEGAKIAASRAVPSIGIPPSTSLEQQPQEQQGVWPTSSGSASNRGGDGVGEKAGSLTVEEIMSELRTVEVSSLTRDGAYDHLVALCSAANTARLPPRPESSETIITPTTPTAAAVPTAATNAVMDNARLVAEAGDGGGTAAAAAAAAASPAAAASTATMGLRASVTACRRRVSTAKHLVGHVVVVGFPARPSHLECFLRPLKGWTGRAGMGGGREVGGGCVPVVLVADDVSGLESALEVVDRHGYVNTSEVYLFEGSPVSRTDLENAGVRTAKAVLVMKDSKERCAYCKDLDLVELFSFASLAGPCSVNNSYNAERLVCAIAIPIFAILLISLVHDFFLSRALPPRRTVLVNWAWVRRRWAQRLFVAVSRLWYHYLPIRVHVVVELESSANVRFLHARAEANSLSAIAGLGGAGSGGAADEAHYLWPKFAAGMTYNSSFVDSMFGQAFYRPSRALSL
ncbi:unnamed protein product [Ectocarpus sp. CCAP 1310/34]|nr:unnamed protein product [Ectocarpus sp. CCAP 1310/34]